MARDTSPRRPRRQPNITSHGSESRSKRSLSEIGLLLALMTSLVRVNALEARWGHAAALTSSPPTLLLISGKTTSSDGQTYTSTSSSSTTLSIPLSSAFSLTNSSAIDASTVPIASSSITSGPEAAWGNAEVLSDGSVWWFGGLDGEASVQTGNDSMWFERQSGSNEGGRTWSQSTASDGSDQPMRRVGGASCTLGSKTYLTAGIKGDGSDLGITSTYVYDNDASQFTLLSSGDLPIDLVQPSLHCLTNGTLLLLGGYSPSKSSLSPLSTAYTLDTTASSGGSWQTTTLGAQDLSGTAITNPVGRRSHLAVTFGNGKGVFVYGGGTGADGLENVLSDAWVLDLEAGSWIQAEPSGTSPGGRLDARGVAIGESQVLFFGGYQTDAAADARLYLYDLGTNAFLDTFSPPSSWSSSTSSSTTSSATASTDTVGGSEAGASANGPVVTLIPTTVTITQTMTTSIPMTSLSEVSLTSMDDGQWHPSTTQDASATALTTTAYALSSYTTTLVTISTVASTLASASDGLTHSSSTGGAIDATYTGIIPGHATSTNTNGGSTYHRPSATSSSTDDQQTAAHAKRVALAVGTSLGAAALIGAGAGFFIVRKRRRSAGGEGDWGGTEEWGLVHGSDADDDDHSYVGGGTWGDAANVPGRGEKRARYFGGLVGMFGGVLGGGGGRSEGEKVGPRRFNMLEDEDTRRFETYPPPRHDGEGSTSTRGGGSGGEAWGAMGAMGAWLNRSSSLVGSLVSGGGGSRGGASEATGQSVMETRGVDRRRASALSSESRAWAHSQDHNQEDEEGDLGLLGGMVHNGDDDDEEEDEDPFHDNDPFSDDAVLANTHRLPRTSPLDESYISPLIPRTRLHPDREDGFATGGKPSALPRSSGMTSFYPDVPSSVLPSDVSHEDSADSRHPSTEESYTSVAGGSSSTPPTSASSHPTSSLPRPSSGAIASLKPSATFPHQPHSATTPTATATHASSPITRSQSSTSHSSLQSGWRKVLGLGLRTKSPPPVSTTSYYPSHRLFVDPSTPPVLDFVEEERGLSALGRETRGLLGLVGEHGSRSGGYHLHDSSLNDSLRSARTANSDAIDRYVNMDIVHVQRSHSTGSTSTLTTEISTPGATPEWSSQSRYEPHLYRASSSASTSSARRSSLGSHRDPFEDRALTTTVIPLPSHPRYHQHRIVPPRDSFSTTSNALSPPHRPSSPVRPDLTSPPTGSSPLPTSVSSSPLLASRASPSSLYSPYTSQQTSPRPPPLARSVRETVAAFESSTTHTTPSATLLSTPSTSSHPSPSSAYSTPPIHRQRRRLDEISILTSPPAPLNIIKRAHRNSSLYPPPPAATTVGHSPNRDQPTASPGRRRQKTTSFVAVPRPKLGIANPDVDVDL